MKKLDMITTQVLSNRLKEITRIMSQTLFRTGYSVILRESYDGSSGITDRRGNCIVAEGLTMHTVPYSKNVEGILKAWPSEEIRDGDTFIVNDPYASGIFHMSDVAAATPVFYGGELIAFCASISHKPDIGGLAPGSQSAASRSIYHEGILIPPVKYYDAGRLNESIVRLVMHNSRVPYLLAGDIRGQVGCTRQGAQKLKELCDEFGVEVVTGCFDELLNSTERQMRAALAALPDGESEAERHLDHDGADLTKPVKIHLRLRKKGERVFFDFSGSDPQTVGPVNLGPSLVESAAIMGLLMFLDPTIEVNQKAASMIEVTVPEGCVLNPRFPAPRNHYWPTGCMVFNCILACLAQLYPEKAAAEPGIGTGAITFGYAGTRTGQHYVQHEILMSALGGSKRGDGCSTLLPLMNTTLTAPVEIIETEYPVTVTEFSMRRDSGGAGKYRGGLAFVREYRVLADCVFTARLSNMDSASEGIVGGKSPQPPRTVINPGTPGERVLPSLITLDVSKGDVIRMEMSGGGGYGDPLQRDKDAIIWDLLDGYISPEQAKDVYGFEADWKAPEDAS